MTSLGNNREMGTDLPLGLSWPLAIPTLLAGWVLVLAVHFETSISLVRTWASSDLYGHGFLIAPVAGYMLWRRRHRLQAVAARPFPWGIAAIGLAVMVWLVGEATATNTLRHLGLIAMLQGFYLAILGPAVARISIYPLLYLFMAVPFGGGLIEPLQVATAHGAVLLLQATGIPVHLDGFLLTIPAGRFNIAEACAGVRFLLSTLALAWLAADLLYTSPWRRAIFFGLAILVPLAANALRAYSIMFIATVRGPGSAAAFDHVTYGLVFLGFVIILLLLTGLLFRDRAAVTAPQAPALPGQGARGSVLGLSIVALLSLAIVALPALLAGRGDRVQADLAVSSLMAPNTSAPWRPVPDRTAAWRPSIPGVDAEVLRSYATEAAEVTVYIGYFTEEQQGAEAVNELNDWAGPGGWKIRDTTRAVLPVDGATLDIPCLSLTRGAKRRLVCHWYWVDGEMTGSPYIAKLLRLRARLFGGTQAAAVLALSSPYQLSSDDAQAVLMDFLSKIESISGLLGRTTRRSHAKTLFLG